MDVYEAAVNRRTIRRFKQDRIPTEVLEKMVNAARLAPSGANLQPCEYVVVTDPIKVDRMFPCLKWATYIAPSGDPAEGERPTAYIVVLLNRMVRETGGAHDAAAAIENMLLVAYEEGIGSCWLGSADREKVRMILSIPSNYEIDSVVALGYPNELPILEEAQGSIRYWKDEEGVLHVPKKRLKDVTHLNGYEGHA
jgi:nitroreductase